VTGHGVATWAGSRSGVSDSGGSMAHRCAHGSPSLWLDRSRRRPRRLVLGVVLPPMEPRPEDLDDAGLAGAIGRGDQAALAEVYRRHGGLVLGLARRVLVDAQQAEEITQEVFLRLWDRSERFDASRGTLRSFLARDAHGRAVERVRSEEARRRREDRHERELGDPGPDAEADAWQQLRSSAVQDALAELSDGERRAITLAYFGGHTYRQVATLLDLPEGTIKSRIRLGLAKLADKLQATGLGTYP
jgi:RNA polymerase sigma-70 factor (ECF subfamily)